VCGKISLLLLRCHRRILTAVDYLKYKTKPVLFHSLPPLSPPLIITVDSSHTFHGNWPKKKNRYFAHAGNVERQSNFIYIICELGRAWGEFFSSYPNSASFPSVALPCYVLFCVAGRRLVTNTAGFQVKPWAMLPCDRDGAPLCCNAQYVRTDVTSPCNYFRDTVASCPRTGFNCLA
jgi:hypothetical protein